MLKTNGFDASSFLGMKCAKPDDYNYVCGSDANGIYCVDKGTNTNSDNTYINFNKCINKTVDAMKTESATTSIDNDMVYKCDFNLENRLITDKGLNVMFRQISLNNPFPGKDGNGRETGLNWCYGELCGNDNDVVKKVIINNRGVESDEVYKELDPLYKITLTPALIKKIREYNDKNAYDDFNLTCSDEDAGLDEDDDGIEKEEYTTRKNCKSSFIREEFKEHFTGCGLTNASGGMTCASKERW